MIWFWISISVEDLSLDCSIRSVSFVHCQKQVFPVTAQHSNRLWYYHGKLHMQILFCTKAYLQRNLSIFWTCNSWTTNCTSWKQTQDWPQEYSLHKLHSNSHGCCSKMSLVCCRDLAFWEDRLDFLQTHSHLLIDWRNSDKEAIRMHMVEWWWCSPSA